MINPDYIPPAWLIPIALVLWFTLLAMIIHARIKTKRKFAHIEQEIASRPVLKVMQDGKWVNYADRRKVVHAQLGQQLYDQDNDIQMKKEAKQ